MPERGIDEPPRRGPRAALALALAALTLLVYAGVREHTFVDFDDVEYVVANPGLDGRLGPEDVTRAFAEPYNSNWSPLTSLSLALSDALHGPAPGAYAATNAALHAAATLLLFLAFGTATGRWPASALLAAVFAVHPLHVESVAWISQRKEVLAGVFWAGALAAHVRAVRRGTLGGHALVGLLGLLALLSKPTAVALPLTLLLVDFWPLGRLDTPAGRRRALLEKLPLAVVAAAVAGITWLVQTAAGANASAQTPLAARILNAARAYAIYVGETFWPVDLAYFHPFPAEAELHSARTAAAVVFVVGTSLLALAARRRHPAFTMGWLWFVLTLVPMIGLVRVGGHAHADRYVYFAQTGLVVIVLFALPDALAGALGPASRRRAAARGAGALGVAAVLLLAVLAREQVAVWRDSISLFSHATRVTRDNAHAHRFLGVSLWSAGDREGGARHLQEALRIRPDWGEARLVWATALLQLGRFEAARPELERAAREGAAPALVWAARGVLADGLGDPASAARAYERALEHDPDDWEVLNNLAWIRAASPQEALRDPARAVDLARRAAARQPGHAFVLGTLAAALASAGDREGAIETQARACALLRAAGETARARAFEARLAAYRAGRLPWQTGESAP